MFSSFKASQLGIIRSSKSLTDHAKHTTNNLQRLTAENTAAITLLLPRMAVHVLQTLVAQSTTSLSVVTSALKNAGFVG